MGCLMLLLPTVPKYAMAGDPLGQLLARCSAAICRGHRSSRIILQQQPAPGNVLIVFGNVVGMRVIADY